MPSTLNALIRTYKYQLMPNKRQHEALNRILDEQRVLYNAALEERIGAYKVTGKGRSYQDQCRAVTEWRKSDELARGCPVNLQRWTLKRIDEAFTGFFSRLKTKNGKAGFPRFKSRDRWRSFGFAEFSGIRLVGTRLLFKGMRGGLRIHTHRPFPESPNIRSCSFTKGAKGWTVSLQIAVEPNTLPATRQRVGIDVGVSALATLSDGTKIPNARIGKKTEKELRVRSRALSRCKRGSKRRAKVRKEVTRLHAKATNTRDTYLHQVSSRLVKTYDLIAMERLNIKGLASGMLAKEVHDVGWGKLQQYIRYKAEGAGRRVVEVNPDYTSQICPKCGVVKKKELSERTHDCDACGLVLDRDHASALVILDRGVKDLFVYDRAVVSPGIGNVTECGERRFGNISSKGISN